VRAEPGKGKNDMALANSKEVEGEQANQERALSVVRIYHAKPDEWNDPRFTLFPRRPYLDVDAVLARSLPKLTGE
jgi:hypothetical protein